MHQPTEISSPTSPGSDADVSTRSPHRRAGIVCAACAVPLLCAALSGCGSLSQLGVQPWERDLLAQASMQPAGAPLDSAADDHTYFSKEAATGGRSFGGGGCGCN
jgi:Domain of unknown function (DUF4266)